MKNGKSSWVVCPECKGRGKKSKGLSKKVRLQYQMALAVFEQTSDKIIVPTLPKAHLHSCLKCSGSGLVHSNIPPLPDQEKYPHVAIIGGGIGGVALAVACLHRAIPFTLYERDLNFDARSQGYGLTLQQANKAMKALGILSLDAGIVSTRHVVHTTDGKMIGEWGMRKWIPSDLKNTNKNSNIHIARQSLRFALLEQLGGTTNVQWDHQLVDLKEDENKKFTLKFIVEGKVKSTKADLVVGADGIRSSVRRLLVGENVTPLKYLGCIVILGICSLKALKELNSTLLDSATVFQTANGTERIYIMPYDSESVMWQLSFPMTEQEAKELSVKGTHALKQEACLRTQWHNPIPQILAATLENQISGYPVYDRELLDFELLKKSGQVTLLGDAAHPMSPFKGQGANQALLDAIALARTIYSECNSESNFNSFDIRERILNVFELEMLERSATKVKDSAAAAQFLHSKIVLDERDSPRGSSLHKE